MEELLNNSPIRRSETKPPSPLLSFPEPQSLALSLRASALVFEDPRSKELFEHIELIAPSQATVLITGETGTGKELIARHIHTTSQRHSSPFAAVNCAALSESLIESELFGHERGAFTGATAAKPGWFETAHLGTLFLDEIGDLPLGMQAKLLRVLQEREVVRIGARQPIPIDVRLIAATNVKLEEAVAARRFREDLYYRLNVAALRLLPLRERPGDILPLARHFLKMYGHRLGCPEASLSLAAERRLAGYDWPGNIRELENAIHHALLVCPGSVLRPEDLHLSSSLRPRANGVAPTSTLLEGALLDLFEKDLPSLYEHIEETVIRTAFHYCGYNQLQTARFLGITRNVLRAKLKQVGLLNGARPAQNNWPHARDQERG